MNQSLYELYVNRVISLEEALAKSGDPDDLMRIMNR
jgi:Tfp pilus assembly ATPase PilU